MIGVSGGGFVGRSWSVFRFFCICSFSWVRSCISLNEVSLLQALEGLSAVGGDCDCLVVDIEVASN